MTIKVLSPKQKAELESRRKAGKPMVVKVRAHERRYRLLPHDDTRAVRLSRWSAVEDKLFSLCCHIEEHGASKTDEVAMLRVRALLEDSITISRKVK